MNPQYRVQVSSWIEEDGKMINNSRVVFANVTLEQAKKLANDALTYCPFWHKNIIVEVEE